MFLQHYIIYIMVLIDFKYKVAMSSQSYQIYYIAVANTVLSKYLFCFVNENAEDAHLRYFACGMLMLEVSTECIHDSCALSTQLSEFRVMVWLNSC